MLISLAGNTPSYLGGTGLLLLLLLLLLCC